VPGSRAQRVPQASLANDQTNRPPAFRFRLGTVADLSHCIALMPPGFRAEGRVQAKLVELWHRLLATDARTFAIVEDLERPYPDNIEAFGLSVFVTDSFLNEFLEAPKPYLPALIYARMMENLPVILTPAQLRSANATTGINIVTLHGGMRNWDFADPRTLQAAMAASAAFVFFHGGYHINHIVSELYGLEAARFVELAGFRLVCDFASERPDAFSHIPPNHHPQLALLRPEWIEIGAASPLFQLVLSPPARIGFATAERRLLERALLNEPDADIASALGVSADTVKKTWRNIYERVGREAPFLAPVGDRMRPEGRGKERRRHLLDYLRTHLEELRPGRAPESTARVPIRTSH
jgi:DNA-binding CsgD family transcriptional regulator